MTKKVVIEIEEVINGYILTVGDEKFVYTDLDNVIDFIREHFL